MATIDQHSNFSFGGDFYIQSKRYAYPETIGWQGNGTIYTGPDLADFMQEAADQRATVIFQNGGEYKFKGSILTPSYLNMECHGDATLFPTAWSQEIGGGGQVIGNVNNLFDPVVEGVRLDIRIDGADLPLPVYGQAASTLAPSTTTVQLGTWVDGYPVVAGATRIVITRISNPSTISDGNNTYTISAFDPVTRIATLNRAMPVPATTDTWFTVGGNDNAVGFARGAKDIGGRVIAYNFPATYAGGGTGGSGLKLERGVIGSHFDVIARNCGFGVSIGYGTGEYEDKPNNEEYTSGEIAANRNKLWSVDHILKIDAQNCDTALMVFGGTEGDLDQIGADNRLSRTEADVFARNCGVAPRRGRFGGGDGIAAVVVLGKALNTHVRLQSVIDEDHDVNWPTSGSPFFGAGNTGPTTAVVAGWGQNCSVTGNHDGPVVRAVELGNFRSYGDDATPDGVPEGVTNFCVDLNISGATLTDIVRQESLSGVMDADQLSGLIKVRVDQPPSAIRGDNMENYHGLTVDVTYQPRDDLPAMQIAGNMVEIGTSKFGAIGTYAMPKSRKIFALVHNFGSLTAGALENVTIPAVGVTPGTKVFVSVTMNGTPPDGFLLKGAVVANDEVKVTGVNISTATINPSNATLVAIVEEYY